MKPYRILLVEDNTDTAWSSTLKAAMGGLARVSIKNPQDLEKETRKANFDLYLIHAASVPNIIHVIQNLKKKKETPIVVVTSVPSPEVARSVFLAGAADYIDQSVNEAEIRRDLIDTLKRYQKD